MVWVLRANVWSQVLEAGAINGSNTIEVPVDGLSFMFLMELLKPFQLFQVFAFFVWLFDDYVGYAIMVLIVSWAAAYAEVFYLDLRERKCVVI